MSNQTFMRELQLGSKGVCACSGPLFLKKQEDYECVRSMIMMLEGRVDMKAIMVMYDSLNRHYMPN